MNLSHKNKTLTLLFNPFFYLAGGKALSIGIGMIFLAGFIGALSNTHFDGVLDAHSGAHAPLWLFLAEGLVNWLCLAVILLVFGRFVSKTSFRTLDVFGTQALARWPALFISLLMLPDAFHRMGAQLSKLFTHPGTRPTSM